MEYEINRGVGREVEFRGLTARYLFLFAGGLLGTFLLIVVLYLAGTAQSICLGVGIVTAAAVVAGTFRLDRKYGRWGLMKLAAARRRPRRIRHRKRIVRILSSPQTPLDQLSNL